MKGSPTVFSNIAKHISLDSNEREFLKATFLEMSFPRKEVIVQQGQKCDMLFFVLNGSFRAYHLNRDGKDCTDMFAMEDLVG